MLEGWPRLSPVNPAPRSSSAARRAASLAFSEAYVPETPLAEAAREAATRLGVEPVSPGTAALLGFLARITNANSVVEIGTGTGVSSLALLTGMNPSGILTSIDIENEHQVEARAVLSEAGIPNRRARLIAGPALTVLPKLNDNAYDMVFVDGDPLEYVEYVAQAARLLRSGGILTLYHAFENDTVANPADESDNAVIIREALQALNEMEEYSPVLIPVGDGLAVAIRN